MSFEQTCADLSDQVQRTADWLTSMPVERLLREERERHLATQAHSLCSRLVELQCELDPMAYPAGQPPQVPVLSEVASGHQLRVIGAELLATIENIGELNSNHASRLQEATSQLRQLRVESGPR